MAASEKLTFPPVAERTAKQKRVDSLALPWIFNWAKLAAWPSIGWLTLRSTEYSCIAPTTRLPYKAMGNKTTTTSDDSLENGWGFSQSQNRKRGLYRKTRCCFMKQQKEKWTENSLNPPKEKNWLSLCSFYPSSILSLQWKQLSHHAELPRSTYLGGDADQEQPLLLFVSTVVDDLAATQVCVTVKHFHRLRGSC